MPLIQWIMQNLPPPDFRGLPVPLRFVPPQAVLRIEMKEPYMARLQSGTNGRAQLVARRPRGARGQYREVVFAVVVTNDTINQVLMLSVPDMRTLNLPGMAGMQSFSMELTYSQIASARWYQPTTSMPPEVVITTLNQFRQIGTAGKLSKTVYIPSVPILPM